MENQENLNQSKAEQCAESIGKKYGCTFLEYKDSKVALYPQFHFENDTVVTFRIATEDITDSDLVITNMTVLPEANTSQGKGSEALQMVIDWAKDEGFRDIRATQVSKHNDKFWQKMGFVFVEGENDSRDFILYLS